MKKRCFNIAKFKAWLNINQNTPFSIKMLILDNCTLSSIIYGFEAWGDITQFSNKLSLIELDLLKTVLGVKSSTSTNIVYNELNRGNIIAKLLDRQKTFIEKIKLLKPEDAIVKCLWNNCENTTMYRYYNNIASDNYVKNKSDREKELERSSKPMDVRYRTIIGINEKNCIYDSDVIDSKRIMLTRWRLSSFNLAIEKGRHSRPKIPREQRICLNCKIIEDEHHVIFTCPLYNNIRRQYRHIFDNFRSVKQFLNPRSKDDLYAIANILEKIEKTHSKTF